MDISVGNPKYMDSNIDKLLAELPNIKPGEQVRMDFSKVEYLRPAATIQLVIASKLIYDISGEKVVWKAFSNANTFLYLERINLEEKVEFISLEQPALYWWKRREIQDSLMPLEIITSRQQVGDIASTTMENLRKWFPDDTKNRGYLRDITTGVMEIANNSLDHSACGTDDTPFCYYTIQKYRPGKAEDGDPRVVIVLGDCGVGMKRSLSSRWDSVQSDKGAIEAAFLRGRSSRGANQGGQGFKSISAMLRTNAGHITIRTGTASMHFFDTAQKSISRFRVHKETLVGTQTAIIL